MPPLRIPLQLNIARGMAAFLGLISKLRDIIIGVLVIGLGVLFGFQLTSPESAWLTVSILIIIIQLVLIVIKPLYGLLTWILFAPFIETWIKIPMGAGLPDLSFGRFTIAFLGIFMLAQAAIGKFQFTRIRVVDISIVATIIGVMMAAPQSDRPTAVIQTVISLHLPPLIIYFFAKNLVQNKTDFHMLLWTMVILGTAVATYAIYEQSTGHILFLDKGVSAEGLRTNYTENLRLLRGLLGLPGNFGRVLAATIPISFFLFFENKNVSRKILLIGLLVVQASGIFLTYNRTSWYGLLISLFLIQFFYPQFRKLFLVIVFVAAIVLWSTWDQVNESAVVNERINSENSTLDGREARWQAGYNMWLAKPIRGWGFGRYQTMSGGFRTDGDSRNFQAIENDYLHILVGAGLVGFLPYFIFLVVPLINSLRLFVVARAPNWSGFIKTEAIAIYWGIIISFLIGSYTQIQTEAIVKMIPFAIAGAVVGSHEYLLRGLKAKPHSSGTSSIVS